MSAVYLGSVAAIGAWIWRRNRYAIDTLGLVLGAGILAVFPTVIVWALFVR